MESVTPPALQQADEWMNSDVRWKPKLAELKDILQGPAPLTILRVNQVDASRLDLEMVGMLKEQLQKVFSAFKPGVLLRLEPEVNALMELLIWTFCIWKDRPTPGNGLMNLKYRNEKEFQKLAAAGKVRTGLEGPGLTVTQKLLYCIAKVGGRYAWDRMNLFATLQRWGDQPGGTWQHRAWRLMLSTESIFRVASFLNLLVFLRTGRYRSLLERLLSARLVYARAQMSRAVSFEYMNRQLVWNEFSEMLLLVLPLLNIVSIKRALLSPFSSMGQEPLALQEEGACQICQAQPIQLPFRALPCNHLFCYYCLRTRCHASTSYLCPRCREPIKAMARFQPKASLAAKPPSKS